MDLNVNLSTGTELFEDNDMIFPVSMGRENLKILVSPGSESSGVSSLDAEEAKKLVTEQLTTSSPILAPEPTTVQMTVTKATEENSESDEEAYNRIELESSSSESDQRSSDEENDSEQSESLKSHSITENATPASASVADIDSDKIRYDNLKIMYNGRDILDFCANISNQSWNVQYTHLPNPKSDFQMYLANRSQYHRLGASGNTKEYMLDTCRKCFFQYPVKFPDYQLMCNSATNVESANTNNATQNNTTMFNANSPINFNPNLMQNITPSANFNQNNGSQMPHQNHFNNNINNVSVFKGNSGSNNFYNNNNNNNNMNTGNTAGFVNNYNQNVNNASNMMNNNKNNNNNNKQQFFAMYRQNYTNSGMNNVNANNSQAKIPCKMYSHF